MLIIQVETKQFLPLDDGQGSIQRVEIGNLNVMSILIVIIPIREGDSGPCKFACFRCARRDPEDSAQRFFAHVDAHSDIDESDAKYLQPHDDQFPRGAWVEAKKHE